MSWGWGGVGGDCWEFSSFPQRLQIQEKLQPLSGWTEEEGGQEEMVNGPGCSALSWQQVLTAKCPPHIGGTLEGARSVPQW